MACLPTLSRSEPRSNTEGERAALKDAQERLQDLGLYPKGEKWVDEIFGPRMQEGVQTLQRQHGLEATGIIDADTWGAIYDSAAPQQSVLTAARLGEIAQRPASAVEKFVGPLQETFEKYQINTPLRKQHFLAQILHESGRFRWLEEIWGPTAQQKRYDPASGSSLSRTLGNTEPGDGYRFRGRGAIQLTGRDNYRAFNKAVEEGVIQNPDLVSRLPLAMDAAGWYWQKRDLNRLADKDAAEAITRKINGGYNGLADRKRLLARAKRVIRADQGAIA